MKKPSLWFTLVIASCALWLSGCQSINEKWTNTVSSPRLTFAYPGTVVYDQSQVATIYPVYNLFLAVDGKQPDFWRQDGASRMMAGWRPIDVLPGVYEITGNYAESSGKYSSFSIKPITIKLEAKAGHFYRICYASGNGRTWGMYVEEDVPDTTKKNITEGRDKVIAKLQKTPEYLVPMSDPVFGSRQAIVMVPAGVSAEKLESSILKSLENRKWIVDKQEVGLMQAHYTNANISASILIKYTTERVDIFSKEISQNWLTGITIPLAKSIGVKE